MRPILKVSAIVLWCLVLMCGVAPGTCPAQTSITIGAVQTTVGPLAPFGREIDAGLGDALTMANNAGGINGKKIVYVREHGQYKPEPDKVLFDDCVSKYHPQAMFVNSTGLGKLICPQLEKHYKILMSGATFSSQLAYSAMYPSMFVPGPTYGDQMGILLKFIAREKPGARVAFFYSDTGFGKDPIKFGRLMCRKLRLKLVAEEVASIRGGDVTTQVNGLKKADPDYVVVHGFLVDPVPELIRQCREIGMSCSFMGTFWGATKLLLDKLGPLADGYRAVNPYSYWWTASGPMIEKIKAYTLKRSPEVHYRPIYYMQGFVTGQIFVEVLRKADNAGQMDLQGYVKALQSLRDLDTGGLTPPLTIKNNRFPVARVWKANIEKGIFEPDSEWIKFYLD